MSHLTTYLSFFIFKLTATTNLYQCSRKFNFARRVVWPLPYLRLSVSPWNVLPDEGVFVYLGALSHARKSNNVIYGGDVEFYAIRLTCEGTGN